ncbi:MAG: NADPH-dependent 7-cyano-7-deazaguanine reductase QueF [Candidatus Nitrohelix vancouverensis]|uniref:NADPH-dependent 7-cyano-7-deazaguanine reductase n=1 Tax=Candidatus Nitrohelix vancouverensis TaxID=2705534 RepID=A0A7T0C543_9BACT|nr:MAG: NADPH-dependent 7-cyano-7-deazaguanine reductase QueF [Candidatus Nitrohelix vancouverensis]
MKKTPTSDIEVFPNPYPGREYEIDMDCPEFTCLCPKTGQPDFADIQITYVPRDLCIELKSLKLYLWSFRDQGAFHEKVINEILDHLVAACQPVWMQVVGDFNVRGGIHTTITVEHVGKPVKRSAKKIPKKKIN